MTATLPQRSSAPQSDWHAELLARHMPLLAFDTRERFVPISVDDYLAHCELYHGSVNVLKTVRSSDLDGRWGEGTHVRFVADDERREVFRSDLRTTARRLLSPRLGLVGLFGRIVDALFMIVVLLRPTTPNATGAAAERKCERADLHETPTCYGRSVMAGEWLVLHYSWLYAMNDWRTGYRGMNDHEGDWEQAWVFCDPADGSPQWVATSNHDYRGGDLRRHWQDPELRRVGSRPLLHAAAGSHALYFGAGDYITRFDLPGLRWMAPLRLFARKLVGASSADHRGIGPAVGVPFVDSARGDGKTIQCELRLIDESSHWCLDYRGLWGIDTGDPLQAERGPSGPKFDRRGEIRTSWADPLGFAGLHGTPPPSARTRRVSVEKLDHALHDLDDQIRTRGRLLPLAHLTPSNHEMSGESDRLSELLRQRYELDDLRHRLERGAVEPAGIRDHLVAPAQPLSDYGGATLIVSLWAMLSVPLVIGVLGAALLSSRLPVLSSVAGAIALVAIVEQLLRRRYGVAFRVVVLLTGAILLAWAAAQRLLSVSHYLIGGGLVIAAIVLVAVNSLEWARALGSRQSRRS